MAALGGVYTGWWISLVNVRAVIAYSYRRSTSLKTVFLRNDFDCIKRNAYMHMRIAESNHTLYKTFLAHEFSICIHLANMYAYGEFVCNELLNVFTHIIFACKHQGVGLPAGIQSYCL